MNTSLQVVSVGWSSTVQDAGRPGYAHLGVPPSGAVDPALATVLNRLVGNDPGAAVFETAGGLELRADGTVLVASTVDPAARSVNDGETIRVPADPRRAWQYLAVRGGLDVTAVLGSRSRDTLSAIGPDLADGDRVPIGDEPARVPPAVDVVPLAELPGRVRVSPGPRADWFEDDWEDVLTTATWTVTASSRIGVRLSGDIVRRRERRELPSEGLVRGAIQVPPDADPVMMLADHPTTGGYPVIAVVHPDDVAIVAQHSAGRTIRFEM